MRKKFIINLIFLVSLNLLIKPFWIFGIDMTVQNTVGASEYGFYFSLFNFSLLFNIFLDLGITNFNNRNIARHNQLLSKHFSNIIGLKFLLGFFYILIILTGALLIDYNYRQIKFLTILAGNQFLLSFIMYMRSNINGLHFFKTDSILSVLDKLLLIFLVGSLLIKYQSDFQIEWLVYAQTLSYLLTAFVAFFVIKSKTIGIKLKFNFRFYRVILRKSFPYALLVLLMTSYTRADTVMLERLLTDGDTQVGIFAHGYRVLDAISQFALLFATLLLPIFAKMLIKKENVAQLVKISFLLLVIPALIIVINLFFFQKDIIYVLYDEHIAESSKVFGILILGFIPIATTYIFGTLLTANGNLKELNIMATIGVILNVVLNFILIPHFKAYGAALTSLITQSVTAILQIYIAHKIFGFKLRFKLLLAIITFAVWISLTAYISNEYVINRPIALIVALTIGILSAFAFKLIDLKTLYKIIKYDKS